MSEVKLKKCIECDSEDIQFTGTKMSESGELYEVKMYVCNKCECEFDEETIL